MEREQVTPVEQRGFSINGLAPWCLRVERNNEAAFELFGRMYDFLIEHPDVLESSAAHPGGMSYPEIRSMIERNAAWGIS